MAVLNTTAASGSERSAFARVVGPVKVLGLSIAGQPVTHLWAYSLFLPLACRGEMMAGQVLPHTETKLY